MTRELWKAHVLKWRFAEPGKQRYPSFEERCEILKKDHGVRASKRDISRWKKDFGSEFDTT